MMKDEGLMMKDDDFKLFRGFADERSDERTNGQTFVIVESLSRLKIKVSQLLKGGGSRPKFTTFFFE